MRVQLVSAVCGAALVALVVHQGSAGSTSAGSVLPATHVTLASGDVAVYVSNDSPTTQIVGDANPANHRVLRWAPDGLYSGRKTYAVLGFRLLTGAPGRMYDWHTQPGDEGGWYPACSAGVAPLAIDYFGNSRGLEIVSEPENVGCSGGRGRYHFRIFSRSEVEARRGKWIWLWAEITWGRRDLQTKGALRVWVAGEKKARVNVKNINTYWPEQQMVTFWEGAYVNYGNMEHAEVDIAATRFGRSPREAYQDVPVLHMSFADRAPNSSTVAITGRRTGEALVPGVLEWRRPRPQQSLK